MKRLISISAPLFLAVFVLGFPPDPPFLDEYDVNTQPAYELTVPYTMKITRKGLNAAGLITLILRLRSYAAVACFDALAAYHPTATGIFTKIRRRPIFERTLRNKNIAYIQATYRVYSIMLGENVQGMLREMMMKADLDPDDKEESMTTPTGIGNMSARKLMKLKEQDGLNPTGTDGGVKYNKKIYKPTLNYQPVNRPGNLVDPSRWMPFRFSAPVYGVFVEQAALMPHFCNVTPLATDSVRGYGVPPSGRSLDANNPLKVYQETVDEVLELSATLTDEQKMLAEFYDDKYASLSQAMLDLAVARNLDLEEFLALDFVVSVGSFDAMIMTWQQKYHHDAIRPQHAVAYLYANWPIRAYGGRRMGTVDDIPANEWISYLGNAPHPEYPSASSAACAAEAEAARLVTGTDDLGMELFFAKEKSRKEPGWSPRNDVRITIKTWKEFEDYCGLSRVWGGVHFMDASVLIKEPSHQIARLAYDLYKSHVNPK